MKAFRKIIGICFILGLIVGIIGVKDAMAVRHYSLVTASTGGTWYLIGAGFSSHINKRVSGFKITSEITAGSLENWMLMKRKKVHMGLTNRYQVMDELTKKIYGGVTPKEINQFIWSKHYSIFEWYVRPDSDIRNLKDIKGKKVWIGPHGSTMTKMHADLIKLLTGYAADKDYKAFYGPWPESKTNFQDGHIDVGISTGAYPSGWMIDLSSQQNIRWISLTEKQMTYLLKNDPGYSRVVIPKGTYRGQSYDVLTAGHSSGIVCTPGMLEEDVYQAIKALFTDVDKRNLIHRAVKKWTLEATVELGAGVSKLGLPFHPGVEKYLKEIGKWTSELAVK